MLSIQPNFTNQAIRRSPVFKGEYDTAPTPEEKYYESKTNYYEGQMNDFENLLNDDRTIKPLKKIAGVFKVISEVLFNGWAVAWGASKGARFVKSSVVSGVNSDFAKSAKNVIKPLGKLIVSAGEKAAGLAKSAVEFVKGTKGYAKLNEGLSALVTKMDGNKYGKIVLNVLGKIRDGIVAATNIVLKPLKNFAANVKNTPFDTAYDKVAKATSTTLGVGAGAASGYNEIVHPENAKIEDENKIVEDEIPDDNDTAGEEE